MADFGIRISKDGIDVKTTLTDSNKKNFSFLSDTNSPKIYYSGFVEEESPGAHANYVHNLGKYPVFFLFAVDSITSPTYYSAEFGYSTTTTIYSEVAKMYLIILNEGS